MGTKSALKGIRVLDLSRVLAGPYCGAILADLGADVIKIEQPKSGDDARFLNPFINGESSYYMNMNRSKRGVTLNLKTGKDIFLNLVKTADVLIENYRPGVMEKLGLGYDVLKEHNPRLIYAAISGFGQTGPYKFYPGYDLIAQAMSGIMSVTGFPDGQATRVGGPICDAVGGMTGALGVLAALAYRNESGKGQFVDIALLDSAVAIMAIINQHYLVDKRIPQRIGNNYESGSPMGSFTASDGAFVMAVGNDKMWNQLVDIMDKPELLEDPELTTVHKRVLNRSRLHSIVDAWAKTAKADDVVKALLDVGIPAARINNIAQVCEDEHLKERGMFTTIDHPKAGKVTLTNTALRMSETNAAILRPAPMLGEHNEEIYMNELGLTTEQMNQLKEAGTI